MKCVILVSHPIPYLIPLFQALEEDKTIDSQIWLNMDHGNKKFFDPDFNKNIKWDTNLTEGYKRRLLKNISPNPSPSLFGQINPEIIKLILSNKRPDVLVLWGWNSLTHLIAIPIAKVVGIKLYLRAETTLEYETRLPLIKKILKKILLSIFFKLFNGFLYLGSQNFDFYRSMGVTETKLHLMPYCVHRYSSKMSSRKLQSIRRFLFVGKLSFKKRPDMVIDAFQTLNSKYPELNLRLTIVGDGEMRKQIEVAADKDRSIHFHGFANQGELEKIYQDHDAIILPSDERETWGLVVNEALANGLGAITSDRVGCQKDLIQNDKNGKVFEYGSSRDLVNCMRLMATGKISTNQIHKTNSALAKIYNHDFSAQAFIKAIKSSVPHIKT